MLTGMETLEMTSASPLHQHLCVLRIPHLICMRLLALQRSHQHTPSPALVAPLLAFGQHVASHRHPTFSRQAVV